MLKLIVGVKGTGKTKHLIDLTNKATQQSSGSVVCLEQGTKLIYDIKHQVRLIDTAEYFVHDGQSLYGFIAGILASNHDITHIFVDSALKICGDNTAEFDKLLVECNQLAESRAPLNIIITASIATEDITETMSKFIEK